MPELKKYDLCFDARMINHSGIGRYIKTILPILDTTFHIAVIGNSTDLNKLNLSCDIISCDYPIYSLKEHFFLKKFIPNCKLLWIPHMNVPRNLPTGVELITTIHDTYHLTHHKTLPPFKRLFSKYLYRNAAKKSKCIFTVSNFSKTEILNHLKSHISGSIDVIHNSLPPETFLNVENISISDDKFLLYVGNQRGNKNLKFLINAFTSISTQEDYKLLLVGEIDTELKNWVFENELKFIQFEGYVSDEKLNSYYQQASLVCMPSKYEGFGYPILEALAQNTPVLCSDIEPFLEAFNYPSVHFYKKDELSDLKSRLEQLLTSKTTHFEPFDINIHYEKYKKAYICKLTELI